MKTKEVFRLPELPPIIAVLSSGARLVLYHIVLFLSICDHFYAWVNLSQTHRSVPRKYLGI